MPFLIYLHVSEYNYTDCNWNLSLRLPIPSLYPLHLVHIQANMACYSQAVTHLRTDQDRCCFNSVFQSDMDISQKLIAFKWPSISSRSGYELKKISNKTVKMATAAQYYIIPQSMVEWMFIFSCHAVDSYTAKTICTTCLMFYCAECCISQYNTMQRSNI